MRALRTPRVARAVTNDRYLERDLVAGVREDEALQRVLDLPLPAPWSAGGQIPWNDPSFSERMLAVHLSQATDEYSRRLKILRGHVEWLHSGVLDGRPGRILDLGCGPGLYTERLAALGHECVGIDFSPASIRYAKRRAASSSLSCEYIEADFTAVAFPGPFDLVLLVYGEFNALPVSQAHAMLQKIYRALKPGGRVVLEVCRLEFLAMHGNRSRVWQEVSWGLFSAGPYLRIVDSAWFSQIKAVVERNVIVEAETRAISQFANTLQGYSEGEYADLIRLAGFTDVARNRSFGKPSASAGGAEWSWTFSAVRPGGDGNDQA